MKIKTVLEHKRHAFEAIVECEYCGHEVKMLCEDSSRFNWELAHTQCEKCKKAATE